MPYSTNNAFKNQKNSQVNKPIFLYAIRITEGPPEQWWYFTSWTENVTYDGQLYTKYPIKHDFISENMEGQSPKLRVTVANVNRFIQAYLETYEGLRDCLVNIKLVWYDTLSDTSAFIADSYNIEMTEANSGNASFTLAPKVDIVALKVPKRKYYRGYCQWEFKGSECKYAGAETVCGKTWQRCQELENYNNYGGFPSIPKQNLYIR